jgi:hypothetical protein
MDMGYARVILLGKHGPFLQSTGWKEYLPSEVNTKSGLIYYSIMKKLHLFIPGLLFCFTCFAQEIWTVDSPHSNIRFEVGWENISTRTGEFKVFDGQLTTNSISDLSNATFYLIADRLSERLKGEE